MVDVPKVTKMAALVLLATLASDAMSLSMKMKTTKTTLFPMILRKEIMAPSSIGAN